MTTGKFITLEGGEGAGKSTQVRRLAEALEREGKSVTTTREPGGSTGAEAIRGLLLDPSAQWTPASEVMLHFAARADHFTTCIAPALKQGDWVICDRFADSTRAYQGYGLGVSQEAIDRLYKIALGDVQPDLTLILDLPVATGMERLKSRAEATDRYEQMDTAFHERLRQGFLQIAADNPARCVVLSAEDDMDSVAAEILASVQARLSLD